MSSETEGKRKGKSRKKIKAKQSRNRSGIPGVLGSQIFMTFST
jgi:hypothetical protein